MAIHAISADDMKYISEVCSRLPDMTELHAKIIDEAGVDGDGGDAPFTFCFDTYSHTVTLQWLEDGYWGASTITRKAS